jgi:hypothetical protein
MEQHDFSRVGSGNTIFNYATVCQRAKKYGTENFKLTKNGKAIPLQAWTGPEGSGRLKLPDFNTIGSRR